VQPLPRLDLEDLMHRNLVLIAGGVCLIGGPLAELLWSLTWPGSESLAAAASVTAIQSSPGAAAASVWLDLAVLLLIPAVLFAGRALEASTRPLAGIATGVLFVGSLAFIYAVAGDAVLLAAAGTNGTTTAQAFLDSGVVTVSTVAGLGLQFIGFVLLGISALRSHLIPVWAGVLLLVWNVVQVAGSILGVRPIEALGSALLLGAYAACAARLARSTAGVRAPVVTAEPAL
jgi:hypothetical protein